MEQSPWCNDLLQVIRNVSYSDWLIIYYLAQSMDKLNFVAFIKKMAEVEYTGLFPVLGAIQKIRDSFGHILTPGPQEDSEFQDYR